MSLRVAFRAPNWLGDAVLATVVPPAVKGALPDCELSVLARGQLADLYAASPDVDRPVTIAAGREVDAYRRRRYDLVLLGPTSFASAWRALRGRVRRRLGFATAARALLLAEKLPGREYRRDRHQVENYRALAGLLGGAVPEEEPFVRLETRWVDEAGVLWPVRCRGRVALAPGASYGPAKRWAPERFALLARALARRGFSVAIVGSARERAPMERLLHDGPREIVNLCGRTRVGVLAAVLARADLLVANDSGPMHLGTAVGTRALALFGSTSPTWTGPRGEGHRVLRHPVPCAPCFRRTCRVGYVCLEGIGVERVVAEALSMLEGTTE